MPQEIEVWYLIPALRRELAKVMIKCHGLSQKKTAEFLGITEAAVSQYLKSKRGNEIKFSKSEQEKIKNSAKKVIEGKQNIMKILYDLCNQLKKSKIICTIHKSQDKAIPKDCNICFK